MVPRRKPADLDERDTALVARRTAHLETLPGPRVGDLVRFTDGSEQRIARVHSDEHDTPESVQTSTGGTYYLGGLGVLAAEGLEPLTTLDPATLTATDETRQAPVWFNHHAMPGFGRRVNTLITVRVFTCTTHPAT